jgi:uncharacterized protein (DUF488 family)
MQTSEFKEELHSLIAAAKRERVAIMCAEAVPWRCHRSLIADGLLVHGLRVEGIVSLNRREPHTLTAFARVSGTTLTYPAETTAV